ncbi:MAG: hypothetical protein NWF05_02540 [Candidatus Bathyarchaeota archaeon]|nr:hypothetical protein [Candidatus Bathyarchaeota archaeon]
MLVKKRKLHHKKEASIAQQNVHLIAVKCECGKEILLVPDLKAMAEAIDAHVKEHCKRETNPEKAAAESERLWNLLVAAVFEKAAKEAEFT